MDILFKFQECLNLQLVIDVSGLSMLAHLAPCVLTTLTLLHTLKVLGTVMKS
jgi:hypothetical protein